MGTSHTEAGSADAWTDSGGAYAARTTQFEVSGEGEIHFGSSGVDTNVSIRTGTGTPEGAVTAKISSIYLQSDGAAGNQFWIKESGTGNTGWKRLSGTWA